MADEKQPRIIQLNGFASNGGGKQELLKINPAKPYRVYIYGYDIMKENLRLKPVPFQKYFFYNDIVERNTFQEAVDFVSNEQGLDECIKKTKVFKTLVKRHDENLPFIMRIAIEIKYEVKGNKPMIFPEHDKEIDTNEYFNKRSEDLAYIPVEQTMDNPTGKKNVRIANYDKLKEFPVKIIG